MSQTLQIQNPEGVQRLLGLAEEIRKDVDAGGRAAATLRTALIFFLLSAVLVMAAPVFAMHVEGHDVAGFRLLLLAMVMLVDWAAATAVGLRLQAVRLKLRKDRRALAETLNILHEAREVIGHYVGMNPLEEVEFRIRLSRLADDGYGTFPSISQRHLAPMMAK